MLPGPWSSCSPTAFIHRACAQASSAKEAIKLAFGPRATPLMTLQPLPPFERADYSRHDTYFVWLDHTE